MGITGTLFLVVFAITTVLIIALVMLQDEQGEGFGGLFGGSGSATPFGAVGGNILARATTVLGVLFMVSSLAVAMVYKSGKEDNIIQESHRAAGTGKNWFLAEPETGDAEEVSTESEVSDENAQSLQTDASTAAVEPADETVPTGEPAAAPADASPAGESAADNPGESTESATAEQ